MDSMMRVLNKVIDTIFYLILLSILSVSLYALVDAKLVSNSATVESELLEAAESEGDELFEVLDRDSEYVIGWLRIYGTNINYPVAQADDNAWFLNRNYRGEFATAGSLFLDYRNSSNFIDGFSIIYGHRMGNGEMFSDIHKYKDSNYFWKHRSGLLRLRGGDIELEVVAYAEVNAEDWRIYNVEESRDNYGVVGYILDGAEIKSENATSDNGYILLSTCDGSEKNKRNVLLVKKMTLRPLMHGGV